VRRRCRRNPDRCLGGRPRSSGSALFLCPGIGEQGAPMESLTSRDNARTLIPTSSRAIARAGNDADRFRIVLTAAANDAAALWK